jgi:hypothetical protein
MNTDECISDPCVTVATCNDPSAAAGNYVCTCPPGYTGNGRDSGTGCTNINECNTMPTLCGEHGDCDDLTPSYECDCDAGYTQVGTNCVCDLNGFFAIRIQTDISWPAVLADADADPGTPPQAVIAAGSATTYSWALREHTYDENGLLQVETLPCGGTTPDLCGTAANPFVPARAYAQYLPNAAWGLMGIISEPSVESNLMIPNALPGTAFQTTPSAAVLGIKVPRPAGQAQGWDPSDTTDYGWPNNRAAVSNAVQTSTPYWTQADNDNRYGIQSLAVPPAGATISVAPKAYGTTSPSCGGMAYEYWPTPSVCIGMGSFVCRVERFFLASRSISGLKGTIENCDTITGDVIGPNPDSTHASDTDTDGEMRLDARIYDCLLRDGTLCSTKNTLDGVNLATALDAEPQAQKIDNASFIMKRVPANLVNADRAVMCTNIRNMITY